MSYPQYGRATDRYRGAGPPTATARDGAGYGSPRRDYAQNSQIPAPPSSRRMEDGAQMTQLTVPRRVVPAPASVQSRIPRPQAPAALQNKDGQISVPISRPTQVPQWPLAAPLASPPGQDDGGYQPPAGRSQPPQRPPRPSRVPSMLDGSRVQDHTPVFQYTPQTGRESGQDQSSVPPTPSSAILSRGSTLSSVGSIPDFPLPSQPSSTSQNQQPSSAALPRRSVNLGPPPSSRRGASSFYSNASFVSPIPEESPRSRSHGSYASSAAMPTNWGSPASPGPSSPQLGDGQGYADGIYDDIIPEERSIYEDDGDESRLVRQASVGKRGKASLVTTAQTAKGLEAGDDGRRPGPSPMQGGPFGDGTGYLEGSSGSSSSATPGSKFTPGGVVTGDDMFNPYDASSSPDLSTPEAMQQGPTRPYSRLSAIRRPPRLDIDAVRKAESRGSLTSLPDLIRRATRLAASLEKGRRPASRFDDLNDLLSAGAGEKEGERIMSGDDKHQSGLSDMLAAFPPPAQPASRQSMRQPYTSWPLPIGFTGNRRQSTAPNLAEARAAAANSQPIKKGRRCCGLPLWGFLVVMVIVLILIAAAIVIPLEFFVIRKQNAPNASAQPALEQCQSQLDCANGGTNVVNQGFCSCICANGFTGFDCTVAGATGCTTTSFNGDTNLNNVTLGNGIPRLIQQAQTNFSIPLSATTILTKFNAGNLSCTAENALITFDGSSTRQGDGAAQVTDVTSDSSGGTDSPQVVNGVEFITITVMVGEHTTFTLFASTKPSTTTGRFSTIVTAPTTFSSIADTTVSYDTLATMAPTSTSTMTMTMTMSRSTTAAAATTTFVVTEEVLDFGRAAVLFILQEETLPNAITAQGTLQRFFSAASDGAQSIGRGVSINDARNITLGNGNSIDLVHFLVDVGSSGLTGGTAETQVAARRRYMPAALHNT